MNLQLVDKNNGNPLFEPWIPTYPQCQTKELIEEYNKAKDYIFQNGVSQEDYDAYLRWKKRAISMGLLESELTFDEYENCKLHHFARKNGLSQLNFTEWNW